MKKSFFSLLLFVLVTVPILPAQQSSKSKSKDRFREKDNVADLIRVANSRAINSAGRELAPSYFQNGLVFFSEGKTFNPQKKGKSPQELKMFFAPFDPSGQITEPTRFDLGVEIPKQGQIIGPVSFSPDGTKAHFAIRVNEMGVNRIKIAEATETTSGWNLKIGIIPGCDQYNCIQPCLSPDGTKLFFASDMPGGIGGYDLYLSENNNGQWNTPQNLGSPTNSKFMESHPFYHHTGKLFFSSNRDSSIGGLDLYFIGTPLNDSSVVTNLEMPFNSSQDDYGFSMDWEGKSGYFASNREGGTGESDIYSFRAIRGLKNASRIPLISTEISVLRKKDRLPMRGAVVYIIETTEDGFVKGCNEFQVDTSMNLPVRQVVHLSSNLKSITDSVPSAFINSMGQATVELILNKFYWIIVELPGYIQGSQLIHVVSDNPDTVLFELLEMPDSLMAKGVNPVVIGQGYDNLMTGSVLYIEENLFHSNKATLNQNGVYFMETLYDKMNKYSGMEVELIVHTDTQGDSRLKQQLSDERAKNTMIYLLSRGLAPERIRASGAGGSQPLVHCGGGAPCSEQEHQRNNRVELKFTNHK